MTRLSRLVAIIGVLFTGSSAESAQQMYLHCVVSRGWEVIGNQIDIRIDIAKSIATVTSGAADTRGNTLRAQISREVISIPYEKQGGFGWRINRMTGSFEFSPTGQRTFSGVCTKIDRPAIE